MLEDKIIVDKGIDPGLAALMQNAGKSNMDPAALMAMMNNGGMNGGWWWIWIILLWFCWGGYGFGNRGANAGNLANELNNDANTNMLMQAINGNKEAISNLAGTLNCDINTVQSALSNINAAVSQISCDNKLSSCQVINAITSGNASLASQLATCCCENKELVTKMGYENQLSICNQTNALQNSMTAGFSQIGAKIDAQTQVINDKFCQLEMREMQNKIDTLREQNSQLALAASQQAQTANIVSQLRQPCPIPAYFVPNPNCCQLDYYKYLLSSNSSGTTTTA